MYKCEYCGAPTRPNVDGDIRYDANKPLREIERLRRALAECAASYVSPPCTVSEGHTYLADEFGRRMRLASDALGLPSSELASGSPTTSTDTE